MTDAREYGKALFLVTEEAGTTERTVREVGIARAVLAQNPEYTKLLDTPSLPAEEKVGLIDRAFAGLDVQLVNLLKLLCEKHLSYLGIKALDAYLAFYDESRGIERVEAITAVPLTESQRAALAARLEARCGKTVIIKNTVDAGILGGVKLRYSGIQLDGSVKTRLDSFEKSLKTLVI